MSRVTIKPRLKLSGEALCDDVAQGRTLCRQRRMKPWERRRGMLTGGYGLAKFLSKKYKKEDQWKGMATGFARRGANLAHIEEQI